MKKLLILSGKGGTGKTTVASAFIRLLKAKAYADCDVDAPNLHLVMASQGKPLKKDYFGLPIAHIHPEACTECGLCQSQCRFDAIFYDGGFKVDPFSCEGCSVCEALCPDDAISMRPHVAGELMLYLEDNAVFSTAQLKMGSGTSGLLVTEVKKQMYSWVKDDVPIAIIDGSPGIGCPVIASLTGVDMVLIVTEPSISGISDMERIIKTARTFQTKIGVCVNKYDTNPGNSHKIEEYCRTNRLRFVGRIPFDFQAVNAINQGLTVVEVDCPSGGAIRQVFHNSLALLLENESDPVA